MSTGDLLEVRGEWFNMTCIVMHWKSIYTVKRIVGIVQELLR
jgi:hypothetical protein